MHKRALFICILFFIKKLEESGWAWWYILVIPATQEAKIAHSLRTAWTKA
jgi:hypothetical protein